MKRAAECIREGRVRDIRVEQRNNGIIRYSCRILGNYGRYRAWLEENNGCLTVGHCTCPAYAQLGYICKHIVALALAICEEPENKRETFNYSEILAAEKNAFTPEPNGTWETGVAIAKDVQS